MVIGFEGNRFTGEIMPELDALRAKNVIRVLDLVFVSRDQGGEVTSIEMSDLPPAEAERVRDLEAEASDWFAQDDIDQIAETLPNQSSVAMVLVEHRWAVALEEATRKANGQLLVEGMVPRDVVAEVESRLRQV
jgi:uncharacterized membrane protein